MRRIGHPYKSVAWLFTLVLASHAITSEANDSYQVKPVTAEQALEYGLDTSYYKKCTLVQEIFIATSDQVSDHAHQEAAYQFDMIMRSINAEVAQRIRDGRVLCILLGHQELTSDLPQFASDKTGKELDFYNWRQRGFLTRIDDRPTVVFAEEDVLEYEGGMQLESILIHEFGHVIHGAGFDEALQDRLTDVFQRARAKGIWNDGRAAQRYRRVKSETPVRLLDALVKSFPGQSPELIKKCLDGGDILVNGKPADSRVEVTRADKVLIVFGGEKECYAHKNRAEYWAEGVQCWYDTNRTMDHDHNHIHTREQLKAYDPALAELCKDVLGEAEWRFVSPRQRAGQAHLVDFDPANSPVVVDPAHIEEAAYDYYDKYWKDYWQRLRDKHTLSAELKAEGAISLAKAARAKGRAVQGAILFPQQKLGCANCHAPGGHNLLGPDLGSIGPEATDTYLAEAMLFPSKVIRKGFESVIVITTAGKNYTGRIVDQNAEELTLRDVAADRRLVTLPRSEIDEIAPSTTSAMPDGLIDQLANRQQFLDLLRYMMEIQAAGPSATTAKVAQSAGGGQLAEELQGLVLLDDFQCAACHRNELAKTMFPAKQAPKLAWGAGRIDPHYLERYIADPLHVKPGTTMPDVMGALDSESRRAAAREITHYLVSLGETTFQSQPLDAMAGQRGRELFHRVGCVACHSPRDEDGNEQLPTTSVPLGMLAQKYNLDGLTTFLENPHTARPSGRMPSLHLSHWEAIDIANYLLSKPSVHGQPKKPLQLDRTLAEKGKLQFQQLGCGQCHGEGDLRTERDYPSLTQTDGGGCLSSEAGNWPHYEMNDEQRRAIRAALERQPTELTGEQQIALTLTTFRCVACHQRGDLGGVAPERNDYFQTTNPNLGPQGRLPPPLTGVGAKLQSKWLRQVLVSGRPIRPYLTTRMPQYGADHVAHLVDLFQRLDRLPEATLAEPSDAKAMRNAGHALAGTDGLNCIACHTFQQKPAATMSAVDLTEMAERLQQNWFYHYMRDPQRLSPNTVMPSFWPGGRAIRKDHLDGDANQQIGALWHYLIDGRQARAPKGLVREPIELLATDEAVMLRRSYPGIGKRGIGVGYPNQVNLAFDAEQMRLAMIWKGKFADPAGVWRSQGHGTVRPLGSDLIRFAKGPELDDAINPWPVDEGRPPQHRFKGYTLDELQRPAFEYIFDNIAVIDYAVDMIDPQSGATLIRRTLTLESEQGRENVAFRVATDGSIVDEDDGTFLIGNTLRIHVDNGHKAQILKTPAGQELRILLEVPPGKSRLVLEYLW